MPTARRPKRALVVLVGDERTSEAAAQAVSRSLQHAGIDTLYLGRSGSAREIAASATRHRADAVEVCVAGGRGVALLRELLRELRRLGRQEMQIVVHRVQ